MIWVLLEVTLLGMFHSPVGNLPNVKVRQIEVFNTEKECLDYRSHLDLKPPEGVQDQRLDCFVISRKGGQ